MTSEPFELDQALSAISARVTDEQKADQREKNEALQKAISTLDAGALLAHAEAKEKNVLEQIEYLKGEPDSELKTNRLTQALNRLGELLAEQGKFDEAIEATPDAQRRLAYEERKNAIFGTVEDCNCGSHQIRDVRTNQIISLPPDLVVQQVFSPAHNRMVALKRCLKCGQLTAE